MTALLKIEPESMSRGEISNAVERLRVTATQLASERSSLPGDVRGRVDCLLREIEETVIPRRIQVWRHDVVLAALDVSNRRCVSVAVTDQTGAQHTVDVGDPDALAFILFDLGQRVTCLKTVRMPSVLDTPERAGCAVVDLKDRLCDERPSSQLAALADLLERDAIAKLIWFEQPQKLNYTGDKSWRSFLLENAKKLRDRNRFERRGAPSGDVNGLAIPLTQGKLLVAGLNTDGGVAAILPRTSGMRAIALWQLKMA